MKRAVKDLQPGDILPAEPHFGGRSRRVVLYTYRTSDFDSIGIVTGVIGTQAPSPAVPMPARNPPERRTRRHRTARHAGRTANADQHRQLVRIGPTVRPHVSQRSARPRQQAVPAQSADVRGIACGAGSIGKVGDARPGALRQRTVAGSPGCGTDGRRTAAARTSRGADQMNIQVWNYPNWQPQLMELAVAEQLEKYSAKDQAEMVGRLFELLVSKGLITVEEVGNIFYEQWQP